MTAEEMDNMFEVLYNNITSDQAPGLNAYEKSVFLTKAQREIIKNYFNPRSRGNNTQEGFDGNPKRQIDFSMLTAVKVTSDAHNILPPIPSESQSAVQGIDPKPLTNFGVSVFDGRKNTKSVILPSDMMMIVNETAEVKRNITDTQSQDVLLQVVPIRYDEYSRLMSRPYKRPLKYQAWRLIDSSTSSSQSPETRADIVVGPSDTLVSHTLRYIRKPNPIIVSSLDGLTIDGMGDKCDCKLDSTLHEEILQRAVELAKAAWASTGQDNLQALIQTGQRSE